VELFTVLNELEELIENSFRVPLTRRVLVDEDKLLDYVDRMRTTLPDELRQAKWVLQEREKVITDSKKEATRLIEDARMKLDRQAEESEIVRQAQIKAEEIIQKAEAVAREIKQGARDYADEILKGLEEELDKLAEQIKSGRMELKGLTLKEQAN
jgi:cell division septum initiation protein DivIVA